MRIVCFVLFFVLFLLPPTSQAQDFPWPADQPDQWLLAFVDVETTGLVPGFHEMIDAGFVYTDLEGKEVGQLFVQMMPDHPERLSQGAADVNGFSIQRWKELDAVSQADAVQRIIAFHDSVAQGKNVLMVALNSHFDAAFMDHLLRGQNHSWRELYHYFILDLPSMAWSLGLRDLTGADLCARLVIEDEPHDPSLHTGITGAALNARIYRALVNYRRDQKEKTLE